MNEGTAPGSGNIEPVADVRFRRPREELTPFITAYYFVEITGLAGCTVEDLLHPEWGNLRFHTGEDWDVETRGGRFETPHAATLFGPTSRARLIRGRPGLVTGVGFTPQGWARLIGISAATIANKFVPATSILPGIEAIDTALAAITDDDARVQLLDSYFGQRAIATPPYDPRIDIIAAAINQAEDVNVEELARRVGMTTTRLARASQRWFGFPTKILLRRQRFLRTLAQLLQPDGQPIGHIVDQAYYDQSHFNREFRYFMDMAPRAYFARPRSILRPAAVNRMREVGQALQGLHRTDQ